MERKQFLKGILGTSIIVSMDGISNLANTIGVKNAGEVQINDEIASFGAVHLNNTSIEKATKFWTNIIGLKLRIHAENEAEFGTENKTLVVVHETATSVFKEGFSGLYHFAIHLPDKQSLAKAIYRLQQHNYSFSPVDHTMTQSLYLTDFDNVMVELALETPGRFKRVITEGGLFMEDADGTIRGASAPLDTADILKHLTSKDLSVVVPDEAKIGHVHFYARDVSVNNDFYQKMGFSQFNFFPQYSYADLGAGGVYQHRVAMNSWHGENKPLAPVANAGLNYYHIIFNSRELFEKAIGSIESTAENSGRHWATDPTGMRILLTHV